MKIHGGECMGAKKKYKNNLWKKRTKQALIVEAIVLYCLLLPIVVSFFINVDKHLTEKTIAIKQAEIEDIEQRNKEMETDMVQLREMNQKLQVQLKHIEAKSEQALEEQEEEVTTGEVYDEDKPKYHAIDYMIMFCLGFFSIACIVYIIMLMSI